MQDGQTYYTLISPIRSMCSTSTTDFMMTADKQIPINFSNVTIGSKHVILWLCLGLCFTLVLPNCTRKKKVNKMPYHMPKNLAEVAKQLKKNGIETPNCG